MANTTIQIRTDADVKSKADSIFNNLGITMSDGINIFLRQVNLHGGFPFDLKLPGTGTTNFTGKNSPGNLIKREHIQSLCGKYKDSRFSTKQYFEQKHREKELEK